MLTEEDVKKLLSDYRDMFRVSDKDMVNDDAYWEGCIDAFKKVLEIY